MATGDWHRAEIKLEWIRLRGKIRAYLAYLWSDLTKGVKRVKVDTEFMEKLDYWRTHRGLTVVTGDTMDSMVSMADGKRYSSKKKYRQELNARGFQEVGNDTQEHLKSDALWADKRLEQDIKKDIAEVVYGR